MSSKRRDVIMDLFLIVYIATIISIPSGVYFVLVLSVFPIHCCTAI